MFKKSILFLFYFFPFIFISWKLITLQYCSGFCHTLTWIIHGFTCILHPDPPWQFLKAYSKYHLMTHISNSLFEKALMHFWRLKNIFFQVVYSLTTTLVWSLLPNICPFQLRLIFFCQTLLFPTTFKNNPLHFGLQNSHLIKIQQFIYTELPTSKRTLWKNTVCWLVAL